MKHHTAILSLAILWTMHAIFAICSNTTSISTCCCSKKVARERKGGKERKEGREGEHTIALSVAIAYRAIRASRAYNCIIW
jgi:hypothetical protein